MSHIAVHTEYNALPGQLPIHAMTSLTIYILCHNRPDYARQAILSVLGQISRAFMLVVSDNSSNDDVERMVKSEFPDVHYVRRTPILTFLEHLNSCIEETHSEYFCLFHDDDVMNPDFVEVMSECQRAYPAAVAFGCNARIERFGKPEKRTFFRSFRKHELIDTPRNLASRYFSRAQSGFAPFPGYVYNRRLVGDQRLPVEGGKYADVTWLLSLARKGRIVWVNMPLMTYRLHGGNISNAESLRDRLRLLGFLKKNHAEFGTGVLKDYRYSFIYKRIQKACIGYACGRCRTVISFVHHYRWSRYARLDYYKALVVRALVKWVAE